jgi:hypothetical protein
MKKFAGLTTTEMMMGMCMCGMCMFCNTTDSDVLSTIE